MVKTAATVSMCALFPLVGNATTWDEPWMGTVIEDADALVKVDVIERSPDRLKVKVLERLGGKETPDELEITGFSLLSIRSFSVNVDFLRFDPDVDYYMFLKEDAKTNGYLIATPTTGWAEITPEGVHATYRHSYHQALVPEEVYEFSMSAIFRHLHPGESERTRTGGKPQDGATRRLGKKVAAYMHEHLSRTPALLGSSPGDEKVRAEFFHQHVALELFRYFGTTEELEKIDPFLSADDYHTQISAVRAISRIDSTESRKRLIDFVESEREGFAKVMAIWGLGYLDAREYIPRLKAFVRDCKDEEAGFGGNLMDPRVGTAFPESVKEAATALLDRWEPKAPNRSEPDG